MLAKKEALLQALWSAEILDDPASRGVPAGVIVFIVQRVFGDFFEAGRIVGGDGRSYVSGQYQIEDRRLTGSLEAVNLAGDPDFPWGAAERNRLSISATLDAGVDRDVLVIDLENLEGERPGPQGLRLTRRVRIG